ncbi:MAG: formylglycine-generating enzyme family protein [Candidatus Sedimenticola sp. (ex Thyasira tokunagai)]
MLKKNQQSRRIYSYTLYSALLTLSCNLSQAATLTDFEPEMVKIPDGSARVGSNSGDRDEKPVHRVTLPSFELSKHEITRGQFAIFVEETGYRTDAEKNSGDKKGCFAYRGGTSFGWVRGMNWRYAGFDQRNNHPVVCVSHNDALAYIDWLSNKTGKSYRLPSESEWEYAVRGGSNDRYSFGNDEEELCLHGNGADATLREKLPRWPWLTMNCADGHAFTAPVGSLQVNPFGLHDMHGNVWEWTDDCWNDNYEEAPRDGSAWQSGDCHRGVVRGGSWSSIPKRLRPSNRGWNYRNHRYAFQGFRIAREY